MNLKSFRSALLTVGIGVALTVGLAPAISAAQTAPRHLPANHQAGQVPPAPPQSNRTDPRGFDRGAYRLPCRPPRVVEHFGGSFYGAFDRAFGPYTSCYDHRLGLVYYPRFMR